MNSHFNNRERYDRAANNLREIIAACQIGPDSGDDKERMAEQLDKALVEFAAAGAAIQDENLTFPEV